MTVTDVDEEVSHLEVLHSSHAAIGLKDAAGPALHLLSGIIPKQRLLCFQPEVLSLKLGLASAVMNCNVDLHASTSAETRNLASSKILHSKIERITIA